MDAREKFGEIGDQLLKDVDEVVSKVSRVTKVRSIVFFGSTATPILGAVSTHDIENLKLIFSRLKVARLLLKLILIYEDKLASTFAPR